MGDSLSKPSNDVATLYVWDRHRARAVKKTKKPVGEKESKGSNNEEVEEGEEVEMDVDDCSSEDSALLSLIFCFAIILGTKILGYHAIKNYWRYLSAQDLLQESTAAIQKLLAVSNHLRGAKWKDDLAKWQEKRDKAVAFMDKHKFYGKLTKWFPPPSMSDF